MIDYTLGEKRKNTGAMRNLVGDESELVAISFHWKGAGGVQETQKLSLNGDEEDEE